ncbi:MAG: tRNA lysidine(34) synthetase TilS [Rhodococcus sp.]|nr:tRNA lysidine(34) synthetase TilS [Rhodococcus sp. (in: high G+C Gram-positive bacteria)]
MQLPQTRAILELRHAVRAWLTAFHPAGSVVVALSGGADSLALTAAVAAEADVVDAVVIDHQLQTGSGEVAHAACEKALALGAASAQVVQVDVYGPGGMEAAARRARYDALDAARMRRPVLLGHTLDDQAETVLLGLARGSGGRSIQGMCAWDEPWGRPLLGVRRSVTRQACIDLGVLAYEDPHNSNPDFTRVRLRSEVLPLLDEVLGGGVAPALARTATQLREDGAVLDALADEVLTQALDAAATTLSGTAATTLSGTAATTLSGTAATAGTKSVNIDTLKPAAPPVRRRALRMWLRSHGVTALTDKQLRALDDLVGNWRGQGAVAVGGGSAEARLVVTREHGRLSLDLDRGRS